jgi:3-deoxy-D-manno-octulosonic-acid transferase
VILQPPPADTPADARAFLDHWSPELAIFSEGELRPSTLHEASERGIPLLLVNGQRPTLLRERDTWYPGLMRAALAQFRQVSTVDEAAARAFRKAGAALSAVAVTGRLEEESAALPCLETERAAMARLLAARPVWFAVDVPEAEEATVIAAHRAALQQAHRLLLILSPENPARHEGLAQRLEKAEGWTVARRGKEEEPDPSVEVLLVESLADYGLWYRLAPVSFLGGSLFGQGAKRSPLEAAALGSAILHGSRLGEHSAAFARLMATRATRPLAAAEDLPEALGDLLAPERAARLAQAAWAVVSDGAEVTERLMQHIRALTEGVA